MCTRRIFGLAVVALLTLGGRARAYTNQWAAHIDGGEEAARRVAEDYGFRYLGKINDDWFHMEHRSVAKRSTEPHLEVHQRLMNDSRVRRAEQQRAKSRTKRDLIIKRPSNILTMLNDERWPQMWYLNRGKGLDMNVQGAWAEGITGNGVVVTILDDGLEKDHPDLYKNYDPQASYDVNSHDEDPMPRYDLVDSNRHGTRCAGEVAATANNSLCAVGVAFGAGVGGVRMLDGDVTDAVEARSLSLNPQHIDIYSASWGPDDDGKTVDGPGELATRAFVEGITKGRNGKGSIFVWASGNGGRDHDNCNCDGYTNSIWTLSISSATENGLVPWYSEACSSTLATTYSSGSTGEKQVVTTDLHHHCTSSHTGTSASAPLAAGICALALEANRDLTWRDMQHIVVRTAKPANLQAPDWVVNGVGRNVSHSFGYGLMDATAMVRLARRWRTVPEQHKCEVSAPHTGRTIPPKSQLVLDLHVKECSGVNFLEHVQAKVSLMAARRGDLQIQLTSPQGTKSTLLAKRPHDISKAGFSQWPFMSVHTWGERPHGTWKLEIHNEGRYLGRATLHEWALIFYGTATLPDRTEYALYNPAGMSIPRRPFVKPRETIPKSQNTLAKGKQAQHKSDKSGSLSPPYVVNAQIQSQRKGKARGQHKNGKSANRPNPKPTAQTLRGLTGINRGPNNVASDMRLITSRPRGRSTPSPITSTVTQAITTTKTQATTTSKQKIIDVVTASPLQTGLILLEPPAKAATNKVPAVFQQYPKIQQLYPVYGGARGADQQLATRAKGLDLLQDEQFDPRNLHLDKDELEEWKLVFFGTDTAVEIDDELDKDKPLPPVVHQEIHNNAPSDVRHNAVDTEGDPWTGSQQMDRVSHPEAQRPTTENQTSGCAAFEAGGSGCLVCKRDWYHNNGSCLRQCPSGTYAVRNDDDSGAFCTACHYSCLSCKGPSDADCITCRADSIFMWNNGRTVCVLSSLSWRMQSTMWFYRMTVVFLVNLAVIIAVVIYFAFIWYIRKSKSVHRYSKVSYSGNGEVHADTEQLRNTCVSDSE
ncbi:furin-like protease 1, isoforms 1/1-X/2 isoform X1 [Pogonomyrmex barbatus]|uniref:furin n=1 Tax=Pogonomyrmex barbatus TaxID=144034 RepID=A0A6I9WI71_9HYME|nr:furin-like protease 1, isoforms 1/1-X/2 isoform X1 [Pogonomyrmex barbatus]XP_011642626.1 furin-like protease 1, isoforms 1/1-X/2 isoform X1 [Pogonomyrmex barbatus]XP_025074954.1 furin-like protease 1, isoforms 1/1-X/2 isoform X1 [Pogonomyrmex barbatus]